MSSAAIAQEFGFSQLGLFDAERKSARPPLKWAGGKTRLLSALRRSIPPTFNTYFEPFMGGAALFFDTNPQSAVLGDSNPELINFYEVLRDGGRAASAHFSRLWAIPLVACLGALAGAVLVFSIAPEAEGHGTDASIVKDRRARSARASAHSSLGSST